HHRKEQCNCQRSVLRNVKRAAPRRNQDDEGFFGGIGARRNGIGAKNGERLDFIEPLMDFLRRFEGTPNENAFERAIGFFEPTNGLCDLRRSYKMPGSDAAEIMLKRGLNANIVIAGAYAMFLF